MHRRKRKDRDFWRKADSKTHAKEILENLIQEIDEKGNKSLDAAKITFNHLADFHEKHYLKPAEYVKGRKVAGARLLKPAKSMLIAVCIYIKTKGFLKSQVFWFSTPVTGS